MSREQVLAFVDVLTHSPKVVAHLGAVLGYLGIPSLEDFTSRDEDAIERCADLIGYLEDVAGMLKAMQTARERQLEVRADRPSSDKVDPAWCGEEEETADPEVERRGRRAKA